MAKGKYGSLATLAKEKLGFEEAQIGVAQAYVKWAPFQTHFGDELKGLLLKWLQPKDLMATYKAHFRSHDDVK